VKRVLGEMQPHPKIIITAVFSCVLFAALLYIIIRSFNSTPKKMSNFYVSVTMFGGLGNQLFKMAAAFGAASRTNRTLILCMPSVSQSAHSPEKYAETIFRNWKCVDLKVDKTHNEVDKHVFVYKEIPNSDVKHLQLSGYFQNEKYFKHCFSEFAAMLNLPKDLPILPNTCFIHLRYGDYLKHPHHYVDLTAYYLPRAMQLQRDANQQVQFLVFSDDIERCKGIPILTSEDVSFSSEPNEVRTFVQMSRCWLGGICANSTFSWWGAYLNPNPARVVTFPSKWMNNDWPVDIYFEGSHILSTEEE
jgi:hypothetical protein